MSTNQSPKNLAKRVVFSCLRTPSEQIFSRVSQEIVEPVAKVGDSIEAVESIRESSSSEDSPFEYTKFDVSKQLEKTRDPSVRAFLHLLNF